MKIPAILVLLFGLFLTIGGAVGAVVNLAA